MIFQRLKILTTPVKDHLVSANGVIVESAQVRVANVETNGNEAEDV